MPNQLLIYPKLKYMKRHGGGGVGKSVRPASRRLGVLIPFARYLRRKKTGSGSFTAKHSAIGVSVTGPQR